MKAEGRGSNELMRERSLCCDSENEDGWDYCVMLGLAW